MPNPRARTINVMFVQFQAFFKQFFHSQQTNSINKESTTEVVVNLLETKGYAD